MPADQQPIPPNLREAVEIARRAFGDELSCSVNMRTPLGEIPVHEIRGAMEAALRALLAQGLVIGRGPIADIAAERKRQVGVEGWTAEPDDEHGLFELTEAAVCYASWTADVPMNFDRVQDKLVPRQWPWAASWWKPRDDRSNLIRAAALIVAEIERLDRLPSAPPGAADER